MHTAKTHQFDHIFFIVAALLIIFGILILSSVTTALSQERFGKTTYYLFHQIMWGIVPGLVLGFIAFKLPISFLKKWSWLVLLGNLFCMFLVFLPMIGMAAGGASRWIRLGPVSFQPSELLKLTFILYLSAWLANRLEDTKIKRDWKMTFIPFLVVLFVVALLLIFQSDLSTLAITIATGCMMYFSAKTPLWQTALIFLLIIGALVFFITFEHYRMERFLVFLDIKNDPMGIGYQMKQALIIIGSGKIFGTGLGVSNNNIPQSMTDSIFAVFSQEMGFIGSLLLILLFLGFLWRGVKISKRSNNKFSQLLALGISYWICLQAFINIGSMLGVLPLMGIPLPFVSYGGSHILAELIGIGMLLNVSKSR